MTHDDEDGRSKWGKVGCRDCDSIPFLRKMNNKSFSNNGDETADSEVHACKSLQCTVERKN